MRALKMMTCAKNFFFDLLPRLFAHKRVSSSVVNQVAKSDFCCCCSTSCWWPILHTASEKKEPSTSVIIQRMELHEGTHQRIYIVNRLENYAQKICGQMACSFFFCQLVIKDDCMISRNIQTLDSFCITTNVVTNFFVVLCMVIKGLKKSSGRSSRKIGDEDAEKPHIKTIYFSTRLDLQLFYEVSLKFMSFCSKF